MPRSAFLTSRRFRLLLQLAWLAVLAHVGLGFVSADHQARMLAAEAAGLQVVCTPDGLLYVDADGNPVEAPGSSLGGGPQCAVCAAAVLLPLASAVTPGPDPAPDGGPLPHPRASSPPLTARFTLRPPPRAPPLVS